MPNKILVVDDDIGVLDMLTEMLKEHGYEVITLSKPDHIFDMINQSHPDLILLDVIMGGIDGKTVCSALKTFEETRSIPVIMISGDYKNAAALFEHNCPDDFVLKPFDMDNLITKIQHQLAA